MPTYFDVESQHRGELIRRFARLVRLAVEYKNSVDIWPWVRREGRGDSRGQGLLGPLQDVVGAGVPECFLPQPRPLQRGSVARMLKRVERIYLSVLPDPWWTYRPRRGRPTGRPTCAWDWYDLRASEAAYQEYLRRRGRALRHRLRRDPRLARQLRREFTPPPARGRGRPPGHGNPESLARALAAIELGVDAKTVARAPARLMRAMGH